MTEPLRREKQNQNKRRVYVTETEKREELKDRLASLIRDKGIKDELYI